MQADVMLKEYTDKWLRIHERSIRPRSFETYWAAVRLHLWPRFGNTPLRLISRSEVRAFVADQLKQFAPETVSRDVMLLSMILDSATEDKLLDANPLARMKLRLRTYNRRPAFTREQAAAFLQAADDMLGPHLGTLWWTLARSGLRLGEALALQPERIMIARRSIHVKYTAQDSRVFPLGPLKAGAERVVQIGEQLANRLAWQLAEREAGRPAFTPWVFVYKGARLEGARTSALFRRVARSIGLPKDLCSHSFRHSYASFLIADGAPIEFVRRQLGHSNIATTVDRYGCHAPMRGDVYLARLDENGCSPIPLPPQNGVARAQSDGQASATRISSDQGDEQK